MMRIICILSLSLSIFIPMGFSQQRAGAFSVQWLKEGLSVVLLVDSQKTKEDKMNLSDDQWQLFYQMTFWLNGFIVGANAMCLVENRSDLMFPPEEWLDPAKVAPSLLKYINENSNNISDSVEARRIMMSWYYANHPKSSQREKAIAASLLRKQEKK